MSEHHFDAEITRSARVAANDEATAIAADRVVWTSAANALRERVYRTGSGVVGVRADWSGVRHDEPSVRVPVVVIDHREPFVARDLPAFVELFFHDAFLLFNIAAPGSFSGVVSVTGGEFKVNELAFDARLFEHAAISQAARVEPLPLSEVVAWYDSVAIGTQQIAEAATTKVLFHLLHLARGGESDAMSIVRLAQSLEALGLTSERLFALRDAVCNGSAPVVHPMFDDALDVRLEEDSFDWTAVADAAAALIVGAIQQQVRDR